MSKTKVSLFSVVIVTFITAIFLLFELKQKNDFYNKTIEDYKYMVQTFSNIMFSYHNQLYHNKIINFAQNQHIEKFFQKQSSNIHHTQMDELYRQLKEENRYIDKLNFLDAEGNVIYRAHNPQTFGDNLYEKRKMLKKAIDSRADSYGFEVGMFGNSYRIIVPIVKNHEFYGIIEVGFSANFFLDKIGEIFQFAELSILIDKNRAMQEIKYLNVAVGNKFYSTNHDYIRFLDFLDTANSKEIQLGSSYYHLIPNLSIHAIQENDIFFSLAFDVTSLKNDLYYFIYKAIAAFFIGIVFLYALVYKAVDKYEESLQNQQLELEKLNKTLQEKIVIEVEQNLKKDKLLVAQSRSAAMGDMIANIAHQWRQPIASISMILQNIMFDLDFDKSKPINPTDLSNQLKQTTKILTEMSKIIDVFRDFFRPKPFQKFKLEERVFEVNRLVESVFLTYGIHIKTTIKTENIEVWGLPNEINQVIINIVNNARDQIIAKEPENKDIEIIVYKNNAYGIIQIKDFAGGVPEDILDKIFDPYFTTKSNAQGTGIGLDMCKTIMEKANGHISVSNYSATDNNTTFYGACFEIYLPIMNENG